MTQKHGGETQIVFIDIQEDPGGVTTDDSWPSINLPAKKSLLQPQQIIDHPILWYVSQNQQQFLTMCKIPASNLRISGMRDLYIDICRGVSQLWVFD